MIRKCIAKINSFIQWTKKCSFTHLYVIFSIPLSFFCSLLLLPISFLEDMGDGPNLSPLPVAIIGYHLLNIFFSTILAILIKIIAKIFRKQFVINKFFLENPGYNIFYIASWILIIFPFVYFSL